MVTKSSTNGGQQQYNQQQQQTQLYAAGGHPRGGGPPPPPATNQGVPGSNPAVGGPPNPNQLTLNQLQDMAIQYMISPEATVPKRILPLIPCIHYTMVLFKEQLHVFLGEFCFATRGALLVPNNSAWKLEPDL